MLGWHRWLQEDQECGCRGRPASARCEQVARSRPSSQRSLQLVWTSQLSSWPACSRQWRCAGGGGGCSWYETQPDGGSSRRLGRTRASPPDPGSQTPALGTTSSFSACLLENTGCTSVKLVLWIVHTQLVLTKGLRDLLLISFSSFKFFSLFPRQLENVLQQISPTNCLAGGLESTAEPAVSSTWRVCFTNLNRFL